MSSVISIVLQQMFAFEQTYLQDTIVILIINFSTGVSLQDAAMRPVLCAVCEGGYHKLLERLLDKGADPNARVKVLIILC